MVGLPLHLHRPIVRLLRNFTIASLWISPLLMFARLFLSHDCMPYT